MAFVDGFEYDVFLSYARVDNVAVPPDLPWVDRFHAHLQVALDKRAGRQGAIALFRDDQELGPGHFLDDRIRGALESSAVLLCLTSSGFLHPDCYCSKELACFDARLKTDDIGSRIGDLGRCFNVLLEDIPRSRWPASFEGRLAYPMFQGTGDDAFVLDPSSADFTAAVKKLVTYVWEVLSAFPKTNHQPEQNPARPRIVFTAVSESLSRARMKVVNELNATGKVEALCAPPPPENDYNDALERILGQATLSVHLMDEHFDEPAASQLDYPRHQWEAARQMGLPSVLWIPKRVPIPNSKSGEPGLEFLRELDSADRARGQYTVIRTQTVAELPQQVLERASQQHSTIDEGNYALLVDFHDKDIEAAITLVQGLAQCGITIRMHQQSGSPTQNMQELEHKLAHAQAFLTVCGRVESTWAACRVDWAIQRTVAGRFPIKGFFVFLAPPAKMIQMRCPPAIRHKVLDNTERPALSEEVRTYLLNELKSHE